MQQMAASRVVRSTARSKQARAGTSTKVLLGGLRAQIPSTVHALAGCRSTFSTGGGASLRKSYGSLSRASHEKHDSAGSTVAHLPKKVGGKGKTCKSAAKRFKVTGSGKVCVSALLSFSFSRFCCAATHAHFRPIGPMHSRVSRTRLRAQKLSGSRSASVLSMRLFCIMLLHLTGAFSQARQATHQPQPDFAAAAQEATVGCYWPGRHW